jgi:hypothetical protein
MGLNDAETPASHAPTNPMASVSITRRSATAPRKEPPRPAAADAAAPAGGTARPATAYRTFSAKLAPGLQVLAGALLVAGGLGLHLRATRVAATGLAPEEVVRSWGYASGAGRLIAVAGAIAIAAAGGWPSRRWAWKVAALMACAAGIALCVWRLLAVDADAAALVSGTEPSPDFVSFHAGFGWGAWLLLLGGALLGLALLAGSLRELDLRREDRP